MNKKIKMDFTGGIDRKERHFRWDVEKSPESSEGRELLRYHLITVDNKNLKGNIERLIKNMQDKDIINHFFDQVGVSVTGKVKDTNLNYLYECYDSDCSPKYFDFNGVATKVKRDGRLHGGEFIQVQDYLERTFGPNNLND